MNIIINQCTDETIQGIGENFVVHEDPMHEQHGRVDVVEQVRQRKEVSCGL